MISCENENNIIKEREKDRQGVIKLPTTERKIFKNNFSYTKFFDARVFCTCTSTFNNSYTKKSLSMKLFFNEH